MLHATAEVRHDKGIATIEATEAAALVKYSGMQVEQA